MARIKIYTCIVHAVGPRANIKSVMVYPSPSELISIEMQSFYQSECLVNICRYLIPAMSLHVKVIVIDLSHSFADRCSRFEIIMTGEL